MTHLPNSASYADDLPLDAGDDDDDIDDYRLDAFEHSSDLGGIRLAMGLGNASHENRQD